MSTFINLLPLSSRRAELLRRRARQWSIGWGLSAAIAVAVAGAAYLLRNDSERLRFQAEQRQSERLAKSEAKLAEARARLAALREQEAALPQPTGQVPGLQVLGVVSRATRKFNGALQVEGLSMRQKNSGPESPPSADMAARKDSCVLMLKGLASDSLIVASFAAGLRDCGLFTAVERKSAATQETDGKQPVKYVIECRF